MAKAAYHKAEKRGEPQDVLNEMECEYRRVIQRAKRRHNFDNVCDIQTYLGNLVRDSRNPFTKIDEVILHKCYKACYKIRDYVESLGQLTPKLAVHLFNVLVLPIMDYGSEVWYSASIAGNLEVFQKKFFKRNLGVRMNTPDHAVSGELGILPVSLRLKKNVLKYLHRLNAMPDSSPVKWAYRELISLHDMGFKTWYGRACELMQEFESISGDESFLDLQGSHVKRRLDSVYRTTY